MDGQFECFSTRARFRNPLFLLVIAQQVYLSDFRADTGTLFFPEKIQTQHSQRQLHKEESLLCVKGMLVAQLVTAGVCDEVAQEFTDADWTASAG